MLLTSTELSKKWNISARRISLLCCEGRIDGSFKKGKTWLIPDDTPKPKDQRIKGISTGNKHLLSIHNRRYLGNKYKLLNFINSTINEHCPDINSIFDIFAGTGVVAYHFMDKMKVITNDILYSNYLAHIAFMSNDKIEMSKINAILYKINNLDITNLPDNYMSVTFANTYFSYADCKKIGYAREYVENQFQKKKINFRERAILVTIIIYAMDRIANTCGHYDAYRKGITFDRSIEFYPLNLSVKPKKKNIFYNGNSNEIIADDEFPEVDCIYCDPPYNSRNYCDLYHVLENVAKWEKPEVVGVAKKMDRSSLKSKYCGKDAALEFDNLVQKMKCKYIILSYNNTGKGSDDRSNARISDDQIISILSKRGKVNIYSTKYKAFTTGKSENENNEERLFVCTVNREDTNKKKEFIKSPLNYTGGKSKLLPQILPYFPKEIKNFYDVFCGGANVGINIDANKIMCSDSNENLIGLFETFKKFSTDVLLGKIDCIIDRYALSKSEVYGYEYYGCNSADGLAKYNKDKYVQLRNDFNLLSNHTDNYYIMLYVLIVYSFNNQIRFNHSGKFNLPVGKRDFNKSIKSNFIRFVNAIKTNKVYFSCCDFRKMNLHMIGNGDFVYCDPPYLITTASYNEQNGWNDKAEMDLLNMLDELDSKDVKFALSNVTVHKGKTNKLLLNWAKKYKINKLSFNYCNSNYHSKNKEKETQEVLITNY